MSKINYRDRGEVEDLPDVPDRDEDRVLSKAEIQRILADHQPRPS